MKRKVLIGYDSEYGGKSSCHPGVDIIKYTQYGVHLFILDEGEYFYPYSTFQRLFIIEEKEEEIESI